MSVLDIPPPTHKTCKLGYIDSTCDWLPITYVEIQVCKTGDFFCKLAFFANLPRRRGVPHRNDFARTDIGCTRSRVLPQSNLEEAAVRVSIA
jgi:hypothetical protein